MDYWNYERPVGINGVWVRKATPWEEEKPSKRHSDRKITHVYENLVYSKDHEYYSDHSLSNIWTKSFAIAVLSPIITTIQTIYNLLGFGLIGEIFNEEETSNPLSSRCVKALKKIYLVPFYGFCQTILAIGVVLCGPFNKEITFNLRRLIGKVQAHPEAEEYFSSTFKPLFVGEVNEPFLSEKISKSLNGINSLFPKILKVPSFKSQSHVNFVDQTNGDVENRLAYYSKSHSEIYRVGKRDKRTLRLRSELIQKINKCYRELEFLPTPTNSNRVRFNLEKNETRTISKESTYKLIKKFKRALTASSINFNTRRKRFLAHTLDEMYEQTMKRKARSLVKTNYSSQTIKKVKKLLRKKFSTYLNRFHNDSDENQSFLSREKIKKATKKLRKITRSDTFNDMLKNDFLLFEKNQNYLREIKSQII